MWYMRPCLHIRRQRDSSRAAGNSSDGGPDRSPARKMEQAQWAMADLPMILKTMNGKITATVMVGRKNLIQATVAGTEMVQNLVITIPAVRSVIAVRTGT